MGRNKRGQGKAGCEVCGNHTGEVFEIHLGGEKHIFDSFECAIHAFSPHCGYCGGQIIGHGVVLGNAIYCSYQCANDKNVQNPEAYVPSGEQADF